MTDFPVTPSTKVVDAFIAAYNAHDAQKFAAQFEVGANAYEHPGELAQEGPAGLEAYYARRFQDLPYLRTEILHRIVIGDYVIDHEQVQRAADQEPFHTLAINLVRDGKIHRLDIVR